MSRRTYPLVAALLLFGLLLVACGGEVQQVVEEVAPTVEAAVEEVAPTVEAALEEAQEEVATEEEPEPEGGPLDLDGREVTIAIENAYPPFNYIDPATGEPAGWDYDVWNEICSLVNCTPVFVEAGWEGMIQAVADGQFDAAADGITITEDRAEIVDFSEGYINIEMRLLVRDDEDRIESIDSIVNDENLVLGTQTGTTNYETAKTFLDESRIQAFETFPFAVQALIAGDVDAVIIDEVAGQGYLGENADVLKLVGPSMSSDQLGFIYPLGSDLVDPVNVALEELKTNGFLNEVNTYYFGPDFSLEEEEAGLPDLEGREVTIAIENAYPPFNYIDPATGEPAGWDYDVWNEICGLVNCTPVFVEAGWEGMIQAVADGQFDAAADGITITEDRAEIVDFSDGYINIEMRLLVRLDEDRIESIEDIVADEDLALGTQTGTTNYETAKTFLDESRIQAFETFPFAVQALIAGDVDAVIIDEVAGQGYLGENADVLKLVGPSMSSDQLGFIYPLGSDVVEPVNAALEELKANGFLDEVNTFYFGPEFSLEEEAELPDLEGREVTIAIENAYPPFNYIDPATGEPAGWDYDVWNEICGLVNCTPVFVEAGWEGMIQAVADGQFDAAADGITITEDRAEIVDFSDGYINIEMRLLVREDEERIESIDDIVADEDLALGTQTGTTNYETAKTFLDEGRIQAFETFPFAVQALIAGDVDAVIIDEVAGQGYLGENADVLKLVGPSMSSDQLGFIYPLGSDLADPVNAALEELKANGFLDEVNLYYFGPDFSME